MWIYSAAAAWGDMEVGVGVDVFQGGHSPITHSEGRRRADGTGAGQLDFNSK